MIFFSFYTVCKNKRRTKQKLTEQTNHKDNYKKHTQNKLLITRNFKEVEKFLGDLRELKLRADNYVWTFVFYEYAVSKALRDAQEDSR